jgi:hypothetical protein
MGSETVCGWSDVPGPLDEDSDVERCTSGKPATYTNCGLVGVPVCEDHRCRCSPWQKPANGPTYAVLVEQVRVLREALKPFCTAKPMTVTDAELHAVVVARLALSATEAKETKT